MFDCKSLYFRLWTKARVSAQQLDQMVFVRRHPVRVFTINFFREIDEPLEAFRVAEFLHMHGKFISYDFLRSRFVVTRANGRLMSGVNVVIFALASSVGTRGLFNVS